MSDYPTYAERKAANNDGMCPDWRPNIIDKGNFWDAPYYKVAVLPKLEFKNWSSPNIAPEASIKFYNLQQNEIHNALNQVEPMKAYLEGVAHLMRTSDIYEGRIRVMGFKGNAIVVEAYVCTPSPKEQRE